MIPDQILLSGCSSSSSPPCVTWNMWSNNEHSQQYARIFCRHADNQTHNEQSIAPSDIKSVFYSSDLFTCIIKKFIYSVIS